MLTSPGTPRHLSTMVAEKNEVVEASPLRGRLPNIEIHSGNAVGTLRRYILRWFRNGDTQQSRDIVERKEEA